jgi:superfamily II DNA/RNA helicase
VELGASAPLVEALDALDITKPFEAQRISWEHLRHTERDVALIAEAGSGKTLSYLLPLIDRMIEEERKHQQEQRLHIVVPTHDLQAQVIRVASDLTAGTSLVVVSADDAPAARTASIVVGTASTSAAILCDDRKRSGSSGSSGGKRRAGAATTGKGSGKRGKEKETTTAPSTAARHPLPVRLCVVFDEADFMLAGVKPTGGKGKGAVPPAQRILDSLRRSSKRKADRRGASRGVSGPAEPPKEASAETPLPPPAPPPAPLPRVVFVSATVPGAGSSSVGAYLDSRFPQLSWLRSVGAHRPVASLDFSVETLEGSEGRGAALVRLCKARSGRTLVFANSASRAEEALKVLQRAGLGDKCAPFHPSVPLQSRERALRDFTASPTAILVCSGLGARGIDLPDVDLVVEYQLAPNIVEHVHRVGRTARAGKNGRAVSLVVEGSKNEAALVAELERCRKGGWKYV